MVIVRLNLFLNLFSIQHTLHHSHSLYENLNMSTTDSYGIHDNFLLSSTDTNIEWFSFYTNNYGKWEKYLFLGVNDIACWLRVILWNNEADLLHFDGPLESLRLICLCKLNASKYHINFNWLGYWMHFFNFTTP